MRTLTTIAETRAALDAERRDGRTVGFVPTMGFLHAGHRALIERSVADCDVTVVSIFVNPLQFGAGEDLDAYPRDLERDTELASAAGAAVLFVPEGAEMYPRPVLTTVSVAEVSSPMEGESRPTHFAGVATVVAKLFNIIGPCRAYFGEKDFQQLAVIRRMASDLDMPVDVVGCETVREPDGLALSSRNAYLTPEERAVAPRLHQALQAGRAAIEAGERDPAAVEAVMAAVVGGEAGFRLDYARVVAAGTLTPVDPLAGEVRLLAAAHLGRARLIDNLGATVEAPTD